MTTVTFHRADGRTLGFDVSGHSGYAGAGADIVCAAVTSAVRLVECSLNEVMGICAAVKVNEKSAEISLRLPGALGEDAENACQIILTGMMVYLSELRDEYPEHVEVLVAE